MNINAYNNQIWNAIYANDCIYAILTVTFHIWKTASQLSKTSIFSEDWRMIDVKLPVILTKEQFQFQTEMIMDMNMHCNQKGKVI